MGMIVDMFTFLCRIFLGLVFVVSAVEGIIFVITGRDTSPKLSSPSAMSFVDGLKRAKWFWAYMKLVDLVGGLMLLSGYYPSIGILLLLPVISVIILFYVFAHRRAWWASAVLGIPTLWLLNVYWIDWPLI